MNQFQDAREFLLDMCSMYNYTMSELETLMWEARIFSQFDGRMVINALIAYAEGPRCSFFPKYGEIRNMLGGSASQIDLERLVREGSPYEAPVIDNPVLKQAIIFLGGWVQVCEQMPDPVTRSIDYHSYMKRAEAALAQAKSHVQIHGEPTQTLRGYGSSLQLGAPSDPVVAPSLEYRQPPTSELKSLEIAPVNLTK